MTYYIFVEDNERLSGAGQCRCFNDNIQNIEVSKTVFDEYIADVDRYIWNGLDVIVNPDYEEIKFNKRRAEFLKEFFLTSLGYIRRSVTMADGGKKDFLSDLLPVISMGVQSGQEVKIIAYNLPDFTSDITDWTQYQHYETVTPQFIQECFMQLSNDFIPIREVIE